MRLPPLMIHRLRPYIQHYAWGGRSFLPALLGLPVPQAQPFAELWMGAHPAGPSTLLDEAGQALPLTEYLQADAASRLGQDIAARFEAQLPFLFKLLDVQQMLSIQAHPDKARAREGFQRENALGIPLQAPHRVFKDPNHKPEIMVALSEFWLLHGFRQPEDIQAQLAERKALQPLLAHFPASNIEALYRYLMELPQKEVDALLKPLRDELGQRAAGLARSSPDYWAWQAFRDFELPGGHFDRGIFSIYLLNLVLVRPGEAIFQAAGIPHAYLYGQNVELMANSDNVFRGGLTPKYIAVPTLLEHLNFEPVNPQLILPQPQNAWKAVYPAPVEDFELFCIQLPADWRVTDNSGFSPQIWVVLQGEIQTSEGSAFQRGDALYIDPHTAWEITCKADAVIYGAAVPAATRR